MPQTTFEERIPEFAKIQENKAKKEPTPKMNFCKHSLVPDYCARCKFGETLPEVFRSN